MNKGQKIPGHKWEEGLGSNMGQEASKKVWESMTRREGLRAAPEQQLNLGMQETEELWV